MTCSWLQFLKDWSLRESRCGSWRSKFGGMDASMMARLKELEDENRRLKKMYAEAQLSTDLLKEALAKKW
jgi:putative transposase